MNFKNYKTESLMSLIVILAIICNILYISFDKYIVAFPKSKEISNYIRKIKRSRYRTAFYGSLLDDILCSVSISSSFEAFIFINGKEFTLYEYQLL